jgi:hypothetical protein
MKCNERFTGGWEEVMKMRIAWGIYLGTFTEISWL